MAAKTSSTRSVLPLLKAGWRRDQWTSQTRMKVAEPVRAAPMGLIRAALNSCASERGSVAKLGMVDVRRPPCSPSSWEATMR